MTPKAPFELPLCPIVVEMHARVAALLARTCLHKLAVPAAPICPFLSQLALLRENPSCTPKLRIHFPPPHHLSQLQASPVPLL